MTWHGIEEPSATAAALAATDPRAPTAAADADMHPSRPIPSRQNRAKEQRSGPAASIPTLPGSGRAIADISRSSKSP